ncbi:MAG: hypothetical protein EHM58_12940 [Ignavibacteriae bacterium]|nr:MAG: hypothetical protein EHM58_12940 [Ignavibacteriota bacterium]
MQSFLRILGFITIFIGIIIGIYIIADALTVYPSIKGTNNLYLEQVYIVKMVAGGAIIMSSIVSGMLYLSFGIVIELLDSINHKLTRPEPKKKEEDEFSY